METLTFLRMPLVRRCDTCTVCCTLLAIPPLAKPINTPCLHCTGTGCRVFGQFERPEMCVQYQCAWLWNKSWPDALRPDKCHVLFEPVGNKGFVAAVEPGHSGAWKEEPTSIAINSMVKAGRYVLVIDGDDTNWFLPPDVSPEEATEHLATSLKKLWQHPTIRQTLPS